MTVDERKLLQAYRALNEARRVGLLDYAEFLASRAREGERLAEVLRERAARMRAAVAQVEPMVPVAIADYTERLATKLREAVAALDEERIRQEIGVCDTAKRTSQAAGNQQGLQYSPANPHLPTLWKKL